MQSSQVFEGVLGVKQDVGVTVVNWIKGQFELPVERGEQKRELLHTERPSGPVGGWTPCGVTA